MSLYFRLFPSPSRNCHRIPCWVILSVGFVPPFTIQAAPCVGNARQWLSLLTVLCDCLLFGRADSLSPDPCSFVAEVPRLNVSYKPQKISPKSEVRLTGTSHTSLKTMALCLPFLQPGLVIFSKAKAILSLLDSAGCIQCLIFSNIFYAGYSARPTLQEDPWCLCSPAVPGRSGQTTVLGSYHGPGGINGVLCSDQAFVSPLWTGKSMGKTPLEKSGHSSKTASNWNVHHILQYIFGM